MITDDLVEVACVAAGLRARRDGPSKRCAEREMRAALTAVLPMIRDEVLEECAKIAAYGVQRAYRDFHDRKIAEGAKEMAAELAATFRAMKGTSHE
jgi:hypothetical protein